MLEIEQLEREWRRYKIRKMRPYLAGLVVVAAAGAAFLLLPRAPLHSFVTKERAAEKKETVQTASEAPAVRTAPAAATEAAPQAETAKTRPAPAVPEAKPLAAPEKKSAEAKREKEIFLTPDTGFLSSFEKRGPSADRPPVREEVIRRVRPARPSAVPEKTNARKVADDTFSKKESQKVRPAPSQTVQAPPPRSEKTQKQKQPGKLLISTKQTNNTLEYLIERFNQTRDPKLASYIAQSFYKKGNYKETVRWAILANSIDPSAEESWILFAKAKVKLGQREDAVKALRIYLNQYSSRKVKSYLQSLEGGL